MRKKIIIVLLVAGLSFSGSATLHAEKKISATDLKSANQTEGSALAAKNQPGVTATKLKVNFPTYLLGEDEPNPMFIDFNLPGMSYFRKNRSVYPYTFQNRYTDTRKDSLYEVVRLENEFIVVDVIPALRGRIQGAIDKRNNWDFLYYNHVIKPGEIAVRSAWISGGIEWCHPGGHGYTQFNKISYRLMDEPDGGKSIVVGEMVPNRNIKWESKITLRPGKLYVETTGRIMSIKPYPVPFLNSNNAAMHASDDMEMIYPPDSYAVWHSSKSELNRWPYLDDTGANYSLFKETKRILSIFAMGNGLLEDSWGVYSHDKKIDAGTVIVSDHRKAPGKKYFTWGSQEQGRLWDNVLSDTDGPYVELQVQAYFDHLNEGYATIDPMEIKEYTSYWIPVMQTGGFIKASKDMVLNLKTDQPGKLVLSLQATGDLESCQVEISKNDQKFYDTKLTLLAEKPYKEEIPLNYGKNDVFSIRITDKQGQELLSYRSKTETYIPETFRMPEKNKEEYSADQLYTLAKSYKYDPQGSKAEETYKKMLSADSLDSRANRELGIIFYERGLNKQAKKYLYASLKNDQMEQSYQTYFLLGLIGREDGHLADAKHYLKIASRKKDLKPLAVTELIKCSFIEKKYSEGLAMCQELIQEGTIHPAVYNLLSYGYRHLGNTEQAEQACSKALEIDPLDFITYFEKWLVQPTGDNLTALNEIFDRRDNTFVGSQLYLETAIGYMQVDDFGAARQILQIAKDNFKNRPSYYALIDYYLGYCESKLGNPELANAVFKLAAALDIKYVFPYQKSTEQVLYQAIAAYPPDANAHYLLGNLFFYQHRQPEAIQEWRKCTELDQSNALAFRNLANAVYLMNGDTLQAVQLLTKASALAKNDLKIALELDCVMEAAGKVEERIGLLEQKIELVKKFPDLSVRLTDLYLRTRQYSKANDLILNSYFQATENSVGKNIRHFRYADAQIGLGESMMNQGKYKEALTHFLLSMKFPENLNEKEPALPVYTRAYYLIGINYEASGNKKQSKEYFQKAVSGKVKINSEAQYYQALAMLKLGNRTGADENIKQLQKSISLPGSKQNAANLYLQSLADRYLGDNTKADLNLIKALKMNPNVIVEARIYAGAMDPEI